MANELEVTAIMKYGKSGVRSDMSSSSRINITGSRIAENIMNVGTGDPEALVVGDIDMGSVGYVLIENLSDTGYVAVRAGSAGGELVKIQAGKSAGPFEVAAIDGTTHPYVKAYGSACNIAILAIER